MPGSRLEFKVLKDKDDKDVDLSSMPLHAAQAFSVLLNAVISILEHTPNSSDLKIKIQEGSAILIAQGPGRQIATLQQNFDEVVSGKSGNKTLVKEWRSIQALFSENGLQYEANFYSGKTREDIFKKLKERKVLRTKRTSIPINTTIQFLKGKLIAVGGKAPNIHIDDVAGNRLKISCTEISAKKANAFLYDEIYFSAWAKVGKEVTFELCDSYNKSNYDFFDNSKNFIQRFTSEVDIVDALKLLHYECRTFLDLQNYGYFRKFLRLFIHESTDINTLKTLLIITQSLKGHEMIASSRKLLKDLFDKKLFEIRKKKSRLLL